MRIHGRRRGVLAPMKRSTFSAAAGPLTEIAIASAAIVASNLLMHQTSS